MSVTRAHLDALLSALAGADIDSSGPIANSAHTNWDIFPRVAEAGFDPLLAGDARANIWWTSWADAAFDASGVLTRPMLLRWQGQRNALQLATARQGLSVRLATTAPYATTGLMVLAPSSRGQQTDLGRLLAGFAALRAAGCVALELAGNTQSEGWSDVAGTQQHPKQTAIFWHDQTQDSIDGLGMLSGTIHLYWRGRREVLARHLRRAGLTVTVPPDENTAFQVGSTHPPPTLPTLHDAKAWERPLPRAVRTAPADGPLRVVSHTALVGETDHELGYPITGLWPSPDGATLLLKATHSLRGSPELGLESLDPLTFRARPGPALPRHLVMGSVRWLSAQRALIAWLDYRAEADQKLVLSDWAGEDTTEVLRLVDSHPGSRDILSTDGAGTVLVLPRPTGAELRSIGAQGTRARQTRPGVRVRRKKPLALRPWDATSQLRCMERQAYGAVALSPDGALVAVTADGLYAVYVATRDGTMLWKGNPLKGYAGSRGTRQLGFSPDGALLFVRTVRNHRTETGHRTVHRTLLFTARTGAPARPQLEAALTGATAVVFLADPLRCVVGTADGQLRVLDAEGRSLAAVRPFINDATTAIAIGNGRIYAGSSRGALCTLRWA